MVTESNGLVKPVDRRVKDSQFPRFSSGTCGPWVETSFHLGRASIWAIKLREASSTTCKALAPGEGYSSMVIGCQPLTGGSMRWLKETVSGLSNPHDAAARNRVSKVSVRGPTRVCSDFSKMLTTADNLSSPVSGKDIP